jgi:hypothetical protein
MKPATLALKGGTVGREMAGEFGMRLAIQRYF